MDNETTQDLRMSASIFVQVAWPRIADALGGGRLIRVENAPSEVAKTLDMLTGIDYLQVFDESGIVRGISARVQPIPAGAKPYDSFTVRTSRPSQRLTEFAKRTNALKTEGSLYPSVTVQAYLRLHTLEFLSVAIVNTRALFTFIDNRGIDSFQRFDNMDGSSDFIAVYWADLKRAGVEIMVNQATPLPELDDPDDSRRWDGW